MQRRRRLERKAAHMGQILPQTSRDAGESSSGTQSGDEVSKLPVGLANDFGPGSLEVRLPICRAPILIGVEVTLGLGVIDLLTSPERAVGAFARISQNKLRPECF